MLEPWNNAAILPPPVMTHPCDASLDLEGLEYICKEALRVLTRQSPLHQEAAIISRFIYKFSKKFRNDLGFRQMKKVSIALKKYLVLDIAKIIENFMYTVPGNDSEDLYAPSRQMLQYVLVRLQTFAKIMMRVSICSKQASIFYLDRIKRGESHWMSLMPYAVLSRIWSMVSILINHSCKWYNQLYHFYSQLQIKGVPFLSDTYILPNNLSDWLGITDMDEFGRFNWATNRRVIVVPFMEEENEKDSFDIITFVNKINENDQNHIETNNMNQEVVAVSQNDLKPHIGDDFEDSVINTDRINFKLNKSDIGTAVSRFKPENVENEPSETKASTEKSVHSPAAVTSSILLKMFLTEEEKYRNIDSEFSLTRHLSFMQFLVLKNALIKLISIKNNKIQSKFKKVWKEKCLDYL